MKQPEQFYHAQIEKYQSQLKLASRRLGFSSILRLLIFLGIIYIIYHFWGNIQALIPLALLGIVVFVALVSRHANLKYERDRYRELINLNKLELQVLQRNFHDLATGKEFDYPLHPYSQDVDLFGKGSFFQYLNRSALSQGRMKLASLLLSNDTQNIKEKQQSIQELAEKADWRQNFSALAMLVKTQTKSEVVLEWFSSYRRFVPDIMRWLPWVFSGISAVVITAFFLDQVSAMQLLLWFIIGLGLTAMYLKRINMLSESVSQIQDTFHQYHQLLALIEATEFSSKILKEKKQHVHSEQEKTSKIIKKFSKAIDALDQRNNMIFGVLGNGFLLWDLRQAYKLEKWIEAHGTKTKSWFEVIEFLDAYNSLANFAFNHPSYVFPTLNQQTSILKAEGFAHPLLDPNKRVANDFSIDNEQFFIITGANMAGKSTFLRTVSLGILMANTGLPVCATSCSYTPIKLITSMRTSDSLTDDESYFFSELKRLKFVVDAIKQEKYFIILDEILKGTNSTDKAIGSRKFLEKLIGSRSTGIIATHDLSLCEVAEELPQVANYYFDAEIVNNELYFDYKFKKGICQNMNASFLLKKMEIVD